MSEQPPKPSSEQTLEARSEKFPSQEEVTAVFEKLLNGAAYKVLRVVSDEQGLSIYEIEATDAAGEKIEYNYQRAKYDYRDPSLPKTARFSASIHSLVYSGDMPCGGECVANFLDGKWEFPD